MRNTPTRPGPFLGVGGMAVSLFLYGYTAVAFPSLVLSVLLPLAWVALFALSCSWFSRRPVAVVGIPVVAVALWVLVVLGYGAAA